jgi:hypothetical protein
MTLVFSWIKKQQSREYRRGNLYRGRKCRTARKVNPFAPSARKLGYRFRLVTGLIGVEINTFRASNSAFTHLLTCLACGRCLPLSELADVLI